MKISISNEIIESLKCYWCGSKDLSVKGCNDLTEPIGYKVRCKSCYMMGPMGRTPDEAIRNYFNGNSINVNSGLLDDINGIKPILIRKENK